MSFTRGEASDDTAGVELFRRAMTDDDQAAWQVIIELYRGLLIAQASRRVVRGFVAEDDGFCVDRAFQRFWRANRKGRLQQFNDLASILKYLKMCLASVLLDEARARRRQAWVSLDEVPPETCVGTDPSSHVVGKVAARELWEIISREVVDPQELLVARLSFVSGLTPRDIITRHPEKFQDVYDVYRTKRNMIERLRRSAALRQLLE